MKTHDHEGEQAAAEFHVQVENPDDGPRPYALRESHSRLYDRGRSMRKLTRKEVLDLAIGAVFGAALTGLAFSIFLLLNVRPA